MVNPIEPHDQLFHEKYLRDRLPTRIIEAYLKSLFLGDASYKQNRGALWPLLAEENFVDDIETSFKKLFAGK